MNELIFSSHIVVLLLATYIALRLGPKALATLSSVMIVLANLFVTKQTALFGLEVTTTDAYTVGSLVCLNLYSELTSKEEAIKLSRLNIFILLFFIAAAAFQLAYVPTPSDTAHVPFQQILSTTPRIFFASIITYILSQRLDLFLFTNLRKKLSLTLSMICSLLVSQAFDTILFSFAALYNIVQSLLSIIVFSYAIKMLSLASLSLVTLLYRRGRNEV